MKGQWAEAAGRAGAPCFRRRAATRACVTASMPAAATSELRGRVYSQLSQKAVWEQSHRLFELFDEDNSGTLDVAELQHGAERFGITLSEKQVQELCAKIGSGSDGLNRQQLMTFLSMLLGVKCRSSSMSGLRGARYTQIAQKAVWEQAHMLFVQFDEDNSGTLDVAELQHGAERFGTTLSEKQVRDLCAKIGSGNHGLNRQQLMTFLSTLLGVKDLEKPKKAGCDVRRCRLSPCSCGGRSRLAQCAPCFRSLTLGLAGFRAGVYDTYAKYSVEAIRQAALGEAKVNGTQASTQELAECLSVDQ